MEKGKKDGGEIWEVHFKEAVNKMVLAAQEL